MSFYRDGNLGLIFGPGGAMSATLPLVTYPAVSTGRVWVNTDVPDSWGRDHLFVDEMRTAEPWRAQTASEFNNTTLRDEMMASADADGYPTVLPAGVIRAGTFILLEQAPESAPVIGGRYRLEWEGSGTIATNGTSQTSGANWQEFDYTPTGSNFIDVRIESITPGNHPRAMRCYMVAHSAHVAAGNRVHPAFMAAWGGVKLLRFMYTQNTNINPVVNWSDAPQPTSIGKGFSWREMVDVCNEMGCDAWFNVPYASNSAYVTAAATVVRDHLNPALKAYVEYANEWWNWAGGFNTNPYLDALRAGKPYDFSEMAGGRSTETMVAWSAVFAGQMSRTVRVAGMHTGWLGLEDGFLYAPGWLAENPGQPVPHTVHDAIAVTGYWGITPATWEPILTTAASDYVQGIADLVAAIEADIENFRTVNLPHFRGVADGLGKSLVMYEGGSHLENRGAGLSNPTLANTMLTEINTGPEAYGIYDKIMQAWDSLGDTGFMQFTTCQRPVTGGSFGAQHYINDFTQSRYTALQDYNTGVLPTAVGPVPLPLEQRLVVTGHSICDNIMGGGTPALRAAITAMGGTHNTWSGTGPAADAGFRWVNDPAFPTQVRALMETPGAAYDAFIGIEAYGGSYEEGRASVWEHIRFSDAVGYGVLWTNLAASTGAQTFYGNFWRNAIGGVNFDAGWRAAQNLEKPYWDGLIDDMNAARNPAYPVIRLVPWLEVFIAVYDAIQAGTVTGTTMNDFFSDNVHPSTASGRWLQVATTLAVVYRRHPDELPANVGATIAVSEPLAAQLRPLIWATCLATSRAGLV